MSVTEIIREIEALPTKERLQVFKRVHQLAEKDVPESFKEGMEDIRAGRIVDMETALSKPYPSDNA